MKRGHKKEIDTSLWLPDDMWLEIFRHTFPDVRDTKASLGLALKTRNTSRRLRALIDREFFAKVKEIDCPVSRALYRNAEKLLLFTGAKSLSLGYTSSTALYATARKMTWLEKLQLANCTPGMKSDELGAFTQLTALSILTPTLAHSFAVCDLTKLECLALNRNYSIKDCDLLYLTRLKQLVLSDCHFITGVCFKSLENLQHLHIRHRSAISCVAWEIIAPRLRSLYIKGSDSHLSDNALTKMTNLQSLILNDTPTITGPALCQLTQLVTLSLEGISTFIRDEHIATLRQLRTLCIVSSVGITGSFIRPLAHTLKMLVLEQPLPLFPDLICLSQLKSLGYYHAGKRTTEELKTMALLRERGVVIVTQT